MTSTVQRVTTQMQVPFLDLNRAHDPLRDELAAAVERVLDGNGFILGPEATAFEEEFAAFCGAPQALGVSSGTAALSLMLMAAGIGPGDEVVVPAHTFIASALAVVHAGATPVFCDVLDGTGLIDPAAARAAIGSRTSAILAVHLYGQVCDMAALDELASVNGLAVFEDAAQAHGAAFDGRRAGSLGTAAAFSFYPSKNLGAVGDAGAVVTADAELAAGVRKLRDLGQERKGHHELIGYNERLDGLQAAVLRVKLAHLDRGNALRQAHAQTYREGLGSAVRLVDETPSTASVHHLFPIRVPDRDAVARRLAERRVATGVHYPVALPDQPPFRDAAGAGDCPNARSWAAEELSLPMFPELRPEEIEHVITAVLDA